jgi:hypothetical protein
LPLLPLPPVGDEPPVVVVVDVLVVEVRRVVVGDEPPPVPGTHWEYQSLRKVQV